MDQKGRARMHRDLSNIAYPKHLRPVKKYSNEEIAALIKGTNK